MGGLSGNQGQGQGLGADGLYSLQPTSSPGPLLNPLDSLPMGGASLPPSQPMLGGGLPNPYATPSMSPPLSSGSYNYSGGYNNQPASWPIIVPGAITLVGNLIALAYCIFNTFLVLPNIDQMAGQQPPDARIGYYIGAYSVLVAMPLFSLLATAGSACMLFRRGYVMAIIGSILSSLGCACILFPAGIWSLVVLCIPDYRNQFYRKD